VVDQALVGPAAVQGHDQGVDAQPRLEVAGHAPTDDLAGRQIFDRG
jgi:hypothetical protein